MRSALSILCTFSALAACSNDTAMGRRCSVDGKTCVSTSSADGGSAGSGVINTAGTGGIDNTDNALTVHVEDIAKMTIEVITLACAGDCADIEAVAKGGNPAYHFKWEDGSTNAKRHVCLDASAKLSVEVTDTAIDTDELGYEAHTVSSEVTANVLACGDAGAPGADAGFTDGPLCIVNPGLEGSTPGTTEAVGWNLPGWTICASSPDVGPRSDITVQASEGKTYALGNGGISESAGTELCKPMVVGEAVPFSIDLALWTIQFTAVQPAVLELWGGTSSCAMDELLWTSPQITEPDWKTVCGALKAPSTAYTHLRWVPKNSAGFLLLDNIRPGATCEP
jgi:hypothetical protein